MINIDEPLITVQKNVLTEEFSLHLKNFDSAYGEGYTKQEQERSLRLANIIVKALNKHDK